MRVNHFSFYITISTLAYALPQASQPPSEDNSVSNLNGPGAGGNHPPPSGTGFLGVVALYAATGDVNCQSLTTSVHLDGTQGKSRCIGLESGGALFAVGVSSPDNWEVDLYAGINCEGTVLRKFSDRGIDFIQCVGASGSEFGSALVTRTF